jgi:protein-disulfide isomerase
MENTHANSTEKIVTSKNNISNIITPIAIIIAGVLIALSLYFRDNNLSKNTNGKDLINGVVSQPKMEIPDISSTDHIRGDKDAKIVIIEYSDTECPFCKVFHTTMKKLYDVYGKDKQIAWVYRHFPISYGDRPLHKKAAKEAEATECANEIGGSDMFWKYIDEVYATTNSNDSLDLNLLPEIASRVGLDKTKFKTCLDSGKYATKVRESYDAGIKASIDVTPYSIIKYNGEMVPLINNQGDALGALPYEVMTKIIDQLLSQKQ